MAKEKSSYLSLMGLALGIGIYWGICVMIAGWGTLIFGWGWGFVKTVVSVYPGYDASFIGGVIGGIWGFIHGFVTGIVIGFFYNLFRK